MEKVIVIVGPTAVGKTKIAIELAKKLNTEIINGDAFQIYKSMNILSAKPSKSELQEVKHHLINYLELNDAINVKEYQEIVRSLIKQMNEKNKIPVICGGSGLYIDSVLYDYQFEGTGRNEQFADRFKEYNDSELHEYLRLLSEEKALTIHTNNRKRVLRAIELITNQDNNKLVNNINKNVLLYDALIFFVEDQREILYKRIDDRVIQMIDMGLINEVKDLNEKEISLQASKAIGFHEISSYLQNQITLEEAISEMQKKTRHYAKRQMTWYRNHNDVIHVMTNYNDLEMTVNKIMEIIKEKAL